MIPPIRVRLGARHETFGCYDCDVLGAGSMSIDPQFHPVTALGLPNYSAAALSNDETRLVYLHGELLMGEHHKQLVSEGRGVEERARTMWALRCALRTWTRTLMSDTAMADLLETYERNPSFDDLVALHEGKGLTGDAVYEAIIASSTRSRPSVNGPINPKSPPPLPPLR